MKSLSLIKNTVFAIGFLLSLPAMALDLPLFPVVGHISMIDNSHIIVGDIRYKLSPTVKITLQGEKKGSLKDLKKGNFIGLSLLKLDKKRSLVDRINLIRGR